MAISAEIQRMVATALAEDIGSGDVTSLSTIPSTTHLEGQFLVKAEGIVAGLEVVGEVLRQVDAHIVYTPLVAEGSAVAVGQVIARVAGEGPGILIAERTALNLLQRMSGIATATHRYVQAVAGTRARILDTRKTVPGLRMLDKGAVRLGGGMNHRIGLYDMVLIKDNHIEAAGSITAAVQRARAYAPQLAIEVEVETLTQLEEALGLGVERIMLDNMDCPAMREAVRRTDVARAKPGAKPVELEASGNVRLNTVAEIAATGVDLISVGALTHSVTALDISLDITLARR
jgi:nicotinate-nucleotide pyrophosphorylase (carboxylating)